MTHALTHTQLTRRDDHHITTASDALYLFAVMHNERLRLPYWLDYYRTLGVSQFFIIDNDSDDGTLELLLAQTDCIVFHTTDSYGTARCGVEWLNWLGDTYGTGHWCLTVDVDELFIFSADHGTTLSALCAAMDKHNAHGAFALMIDMYAQGSLRDAYYHTGTAFTDTCSYFDAHGYYTLPINECPYVSIIGGVRQRLFYPEYTRRTIADRLRWKLGNAAKKTPMLYQTALARLAYCSPPVLSKIPLVKWHKGVYHISGCHSITDMRLFPARCGLLHFKFFHDFHHHARLELTRGQHYGNMREYHRYVEFLDRKSDQFSFMTLQSIRYEGVTTLEEYGMIHGAVPRTHNPTDITDIA